MTLIKVVYYSMLKELTGKHYEELEGVTTVGSALQKLFAKYGDKMRNIIIKERDIPHDSVIIALNGKSIKFLEGLDTRLKEGDKLTIFFAAGGG